MKRSHCATLGRETVAIIKSGRYTAPSGKVVSLEASLRLAQEGTRTYPPSSKLGAVPTFPDRTTHFEVVNESTLASARRLVLDGHRVAALNFASGKNPGGGFLNGGRAQEESLARSSGLYSTLIGNPMYAHHQRLHDPMYTNWVIYSPDVPVFRLDEGTLLESPYPCSFLTSPAVNAGALRDRDRRRSAVCAVMEERVARVLAVAALHGHEALVLGAWGCGVFKNDPDEIAQLFSAALAGGGPFRGAFTRIVFAVLDWSEDRHFIGPFARAFPFSSSIEAHSCGARDPRP
jgi:uncharacterized protein (TIGR02452 family)